MKIVLNVCQCAVGLIVFLSDLFYELMKSVLGMDFQKEPGPSGGEHKMINSQNSEDSVVEVHNSILLFSKRKKNKTKCPPKIYCNISHFLNIRQFLKNCMVEASSIILAVSRLRQEDYGTSKALLGYTEGPGSR